MSIAGLSQSTAKAPICARTLPASARVQPRSWIVTARALAGREARGSVSGATSARCFDPWRRSPLAEIARPNFRPELLDAEERTFLLMVEL
jgi:hypothetical protein